MRQIFTSLLLLIGTLLIAQSTSDFEDITLEQDSFLNGVDGSGGFTSGNVFLPNTYHPAWNGWDGWAISNTTDVTTPGPLNQFSAITGSGFDNSSNYAVAFVVEHNILELEGMASGEMVNGFYVTNATYTYLSMENGDQFAKKFGGITGNDPDYYFMSVKKYLDGVLSTDSINFYLADYRFDDNSMDYIVDEWTYVDLTTLGAADSLSFTMYSSDFNSFGLNTPAYFCVDNITTSDGITSVTDLESPALFEVFPNPSSDFVLIKNLVNQQATCVIYDMLGNQIYANRMNTDQLQIDIRDFAKGTYIVEIQSEGQQDSQLLIKQ